MKNLILIDANSLIHRCFHALPPLTGLNNQPAGALYGLSSVLIKVLREQKPDFIAAFFDRPEPTFRKEIFNEYKIHRPKAPDELISQIIEARNLVEAFGIKFFEAPGFEADDLIGSAAEKFKNEPDLKIIILTGDLDSLQLVENDKVVAETFKKGVSETIIYNEEAVKERYGGLLPAQIADYKGLVGDPSDNIPGVMGIGPKTAAPLIKNYGSLENFLEKGGVEKNYEKIIKSKDIALLSKKLAIIKRDAPLNINNLSELKYDGLSKEVIENYFEKLGFKSLINRINNGQIL
ncbi:MAG: 5'-3' exonuclease H3TH domain-containing protein [bacterium]|nr:5'-3' exonuclease H3TH domain-containing protein [bacterium]